MSPDAIEGRALWLRPPTGGRLRARLLDQRPAERRVTFVLDATAYRRVDAELLFHLEPEVRGPDFADRFELGGDVEIQAGLDPALSDLLTVAGDLAGVELTSPLLATESWFALHVTQELPLPADLAEPGASLKVGYRTVWAELGVPAGRTPMLEVLRRYFRADDWQFEEMPELSGLKLAFAGESGTWVCMALADDTNEQCAFYSVCPVTVPAGRRAAIAELLTRLNLGLRVGAFELDLDDGVLRFRTGLDLSGDRLSFNLIEGLVLSNLDQMDRHLPAITAGAN